MPSKAGLASKSCSSDLEVEMFSGSEASTCVTDKGVYEVRGKRCKKVRGKKVRGIGGVDLCGWVADAWGQVRYR